jgi:hypothetical protein
VGETGERSIEELIDAVPWGRLTLAYDFALDAPAMLGALVAEPDFDGAFEYWLDTAVVHQGTPYSGTAPTLWLLRRIVEANPSHLSLGPCLTAVCECAEAFDWIEEPDKGNTGESSAGSAFPPGFKAPKMFWGGHDDYFAASIPHLDTIRKCVDDWQTTIARCVRERTQLDEALKAASAVLKLWPASPVSDALASLVDDASSAKHHRAAGLFALSRVGLSATNPVGVEDRALRFAAALGQPDRPGSAELLVDALGDLEWLDASFPLGLPGAKPWLIPATVTAILEQIPVSEADDVTIAAFTGLLARPSGRLGASYEWGPVLKWAFPDRVKFGEVQRVPLPESLTSLQERLLAALVSNDDVWTPKQGNDITALREVGLPHDRTAVANLL